MLPLISLSSSFDRVTIQRHFLADNTPALHQAVSYLRDHYPPARTWDLHDLIVAVPGRRAVRRLTELLVESAGDAGLLPPTIVTTGTLPDQLFEPHLPIASDLVANLTWIQAARDTVEAHGGIGFTWEHDAHLFLKRAMFDWAWMGDPRHHRLRAADLAGWSSGLRLDNQYTFSI